jgi:hypothetical protein
MPDPNSPSGVPARTSPSPVTPGNVRGRGTSFQSLAWCCLSARIPG